MAEVDGGLAGFIELRVFAPSREGILGQLRSLASQVLRPARWKAARYGSVEEVYVDPPYRRHGLATALIEHGLNWFRA